MVTARIGKKATDPVSTAYFGMGLTSVSTNSSRISLSAGLHTMSVFTFSCRPFQTKVTLLTSTTHEPPPTLPKLSPLAHPYSKLLTLGMSSTRACTNWLNLLAMTRSGYPTISSLRQYSCQRRYATFGHPARLYSHSRIHNRWRRFFYFIPSFDFFNAPKKSL